MGNKHSGGRKKKTAAPGSAEQAAAAGRDLLGDALAGGECKVDNFKLGAPQALQSTDGADVRLGLSWDLFDGMPVVDLDASAVCFDACGALVDAAYFNQVRSGRRVCVPSELLIL
jgi:hypothetical protein